jgi:apolipoprotein D and lipocalin family protein
MTKQPLTGKILLAISSCALFLIFSSNSFAGGSGRPGMTDPSVIKEVDINRYAGLWNEVAHSKNFFQRGCARSTAEYGVIDALSITVHNVCHRKDGSTRDISGVAKVVDPVEPAKLKVRFNFFARGDYWITHLDPQYDWAVVSGPKKANLFILSRRFPIDAKILEEILATLKAEGYDLSTLVYDEPTL